MLAALASCTEPPDPLTAPCGVVIDGSGSGDAGKGGFDAEAKLKDTLVPFLTEQKCGSVEFAPITRSSEASSCRVDEVDLDPGGDETTDHDSARRKALGEAKQAAIEELECARTQGGSDVWGALDRIGEVLSGPDVKILVVSDFEQADKDFTIEPSELSTEAARGEVIDDMVEARGMPGIKGMEVYPVGLGMIKDIRPEENDDFQAFWTEAIEGRAEARVQYDYK
ncbi:hypothetical protein [Streptomyces abyssomicinicus]|uniref:hypothetical protein n=1 Tax=Streptomyces abyssomicinicus TaxID=574929 RepID=UPI0012506349|nr:hypothetical protein [Streptomyces abyssomicinicus]